MEPRNSYCCSSPTFFPAIIVVVAVPGSDVVAGIGALTRAMVDHDIKQNEDFKAAAARTNSVLLQTLRFKDIMAVMMLPIAAEKWEKLALDYAAMSTSMAANARSRFHDFRMRDGDTLVQTQHRFDEMVNECTIQAVAVTEEDRTMVLPTHPSPKWSGFMDA